MSPKHKIFHILIALSLLIAVFGFKPAKVSADTTAQTLPFSQDWTNNDLITADDDWSGVPGIMGYQGEGLTTTTGVDPQTVLAANDTGTAKVLANQTSPEVAFKAGVYEFHLTDSIVALAGSGTSDAPHLLITITTTDRESIQVSYNLRDIEALDNAIQPVALHYRLGNTGSFTNVPAAYVADATTGGTATQVTPVSVTLPSDANNQALVQLRIMTTNALGNDEWVGIDDISIIGTPIGEPAPYVASTIPDDEAVGVLLDSNISITFSEPVDTAVGAFTISCANSGSHTFGQANSIDGTSFTLDPDANFTEGELCTVKVEADFVTDQDTEDPNDNMLADYVFSFTTFMSDPAPEVISTVPTNGATGVAVDANLSVTFSEAVTLEADAVSISCTYSGAHAVTLGSEPLTTHPIDPVVDFTPSETCTVTMESTLIKDSTNKELAADYSWSFKTYYDQNVPVPIAVARTAGAGWTGTIQGNVTLTVGLLGTSSFSIQDDTGGMYIYPSYSTVLPPIALGDVVQVKGTIKNHNGLLEIDPVASVTWIDTGTVPDPLPVATNAIAPTQGKLITVTGTITWTGTPPEPGSGTNFTAYINDGSGQGTVYIYKLTNIDLRGFESGQQMTIIGISGAYNGGQIQPRYQSDLIDLRAAQVTTTVPSDGETGVSPYKPLSATFNKAMEPATLTDASFTIVKTSDSTPVTGSVTYDASSRTATFTPTGALQPNTAYKASLSTAIEDIYGISLTPYTWTFTTGDADATPPSIMGRVPAPDDTNVSSSAKIAIIFSEELSPLSLNSDHFMLSNSYGVVPTNLQFDPATFTVTLTPKASLLYSTDYMMTVTGTTADYAGNQLGSDVVWTFTTMTEPAMQVYFGDIHNHTSYSDGSGTPTQAFAAGKAAGFDFMAITDHSYSISDAEWADTLAAAETVTGTDFVALRGFEYTQGAEGHVNVWNSTFHAVRTDTTATCTSCYYTPNLEAGQTVDGFYEWLVNGDLIDPTKGNFPLDEAGTLMQFNHPGWINFNDWFYHPEASDQALLEEVGNGSGTSYVFSEEEYIRSLDYGWKVGATNNADTHSTQWGTNTDHRTGVVMPELTKSALMNALRQRRTFASEDKNFSLTMKANGGWMGSEIANSGTLLFEIEGSDPDGEITTLVELVTDQGIVIASTNPNTATFSWEPEFTITTGVHYYYVKVTQADGDRMVTSPVWTIGSEDISITDLRIQPTIPTTNNASLLTVRVTNRVAESRTVNVTLKVNDVQVGSTLEVTAPANGDGFANFSWQPDETGSATITAEITDAPVEDNPEDNLLSLHMTVTDELLPLILIDAGHGNMNTAGDEMRSFINDLSDHQYNVLKNLDELTASDLNPAVVKLLIITAPQYAYTDAEQLAIANYVDAGGSLWMGGLADYTGKVAWAATVADRQNAILDKIETVTGQTVNMRMNDDEVIDGNTNNGYVFGVIWKDFPSADTTGIGLNVKEVATWSLNSIVDGNKQALTAADEGIQIVMQGDLDTGCTADTWQNPFHTSNTDADGAGDAYLYNTNFTCGLTQPPVDAVPLPGAAVTQLADGAGRIMLYGDSNDPFTIFAYTAGDGMQNELFNLQWVMWLLGQPMQKSSIAEARAQAVEDQPDNLNQLVWVEGEITAAFGEFFNVLYVQDETGGITVHAPAGDIYASDYTRGTHVRVVGTIGTYMGDTEIEFFEAEMVQVITPNAYDAVPLPLTTVSADSEENEGWLVQVTGTVTSKSSTDTLFVNDGSGPVRVFLDGYNGDFDGIEVGMRVQAIGLASEDGAGPRIRVRNYKYHEQYADDVTILELGSSTIFLPIILR